MIRVQGGVLANAVSVSAVATQLVWAYDNASSLYGAEIPDPKDPATLKLVTMPVDVAHQPKNNQYVEVLLAAADLGDGGYAAAPSGLLLQVASYDPTAQTIGLQTALPAPYTGATPLFVRVWENSIDVASAFGRSVSLVDANSNATGLQIALTDETNQAASVAPGDYWCFAVRPAVPKGLYPARYFHAQPPEGPREWVAPLAVIDWARKSSITDCRPSFGNLTIRSEVCGCCTLMLGQQDLKEKSLQEWIDNAVRGREPVTICLRPGCYVIGAPIRLCGEHSHITIEACSGAVEIVADRHALDKFGGGLMHLHDADGVTLRGLRLVLPEGSFNDEIARNLSAFDPKNIAAQPPMFKQLGSMRLAIGLRLFGCAGLYVENCTFSFQPGHRSGDGRVVYGGCIVATGEVNGLRVIDSMFRVDDVPKVDDGSTRLLQYQPPHLLFGYIQAPPADNVKALLDGAAAGRPDESCCSRRERVIRPPSRRRRSIATRSTVLSPPVSSSAKSATSGSQATMCARAMADLDPGTEWMTIQTGRIWRAQGSSRCHAP